MGESEQHHDTVEEDEHTTDDQDEQMDESEAQHHDTVVEDEHTSDEDEQTTDEDEDEQTTDEDDGQEDGEEEGDSEEGEGEYIDGEYATVMHISEARFGASSALVKNQLKRPGTRIVEWRARSGERMGVARAKMQEKFARAGADINYGVYSFTHPAHPIRRKAAKDMKVEKKKVAAARREQREANAKAKAAAKIARIHEGDVKTLQEGVKS